MKTDIQAILKREQEALALRNQYRAEFERIDPRHVNGISWPEIVRVVDAHRKIDRELF